MNALQNYSSVEDLYLHISFQLPDASSYEKDKIFITEEFERLMVDGYILEYEDPDDLLERELIYRVAKPIILDHTLLKNFFQNLKELFEATKDYTPTFTQSSEAKA